MGQGIKRVLIYRLGSLGDMVVALPALHRVEQAFPEAERRMLTNFPVGQKAAAAVAVLGDSGLVHGYFEYPVGARSPWVLLSLWWTLLRWRPQVVVYLAAARGVKAARRDEAFFSACGIFRQIGVPLTEAMQTCGWVGEEDRREAECDRLGRNIAELGASASERLESWDLRLTPEERAKAKEVLAGAGERPLIVFSIGTKIQANDWGVEKWRALLRGLGARHPGYALAFTGVSEEREASAFAAEGWREGAGEESPVIDLCGLLTPRESAACYERAQVFLGHDSGPMHLAAAVGTRVVAVFSARNLAGIWFPRPGRHCVLYHPVHCMGCRLQTCVVERKQCIESITVEEVLAGVESVLG